MTCSARVFLRRSLDGGRRDPIKGLDSRHIPKLRLVLTALDVASEPDDLRLPSFRLHKLSGDREGQWSVTVQASWRIVFRFDGPDVTGVDLVDYR